MLCIHGLYIVLFFFLNANLQGHLVFYLPMYICLCVISYINILYRLLLFRS